MIFQRLISQGFSFVFPVSKGKADFRASPLGFPQREPERATSRLALPGYTVSVGRGVCKPTIEHWSSLLGSRQRLSPPSSTRGREGTLQCRLGIAGIV